MNRAALALLLCMFCPPPLQAQEGTNGRVSAEAMRATDGIQVDGRLDESVWSLAAVLADFRQRLPREGEPVSERTEVRLLYDGHALYVGAWLFDGNPDGIVAGENRRDVDLSDADAFVILLDTYRDRQNGFVFGTTPAGIEYDGQVTREGQGGAGGGGRQQRGSGGGFNKNWDGGWRVATSRDERGWYAEFEIPFSTLRYASGGEQTWGLNLARRIRRRNEESFWAPIPRQFDLYRVSLAGILTLAEAPANLPLAFTPFVAATGRRNYLADSDVDGTAEFGADAKIGLASNLTLDLTWNTDFAQVEVDDEQINLTRFSQFFPEKRPFFLENAGTFSIGTGQEVEVFFSRRIGIEGGNRIPIVGGGRMTGRVAGFTVGLMDIQTERVRARDADADTTIQIAPPNNFSILRALRELPNRSRIGFAVVNRLNTDDTDDYNTTLAADGRLGIGQSIQLDGYASRSVTPGIDGGEHAYGVTAALTLPLWEATTAFREVGEGFNPEVGFLRRNGYRFAMGHIRRTVRFPQISWFRELRPHASYRQYRYLDGFIETGWLHLDSHFEFSNGAFFQLPALNHTREGLKEPFEIAQGIVVPAGTYQGWEWGFAYNTDESARLSIDGRIDIGAFYSGHRKGTETSLNARFGDALVASLRVDYYDIDLAQGSFETAVLGVRAAYSFTPRIYLQSLLQYNNQTRNFSSNVRFGWLGTAGTGLFVVYNDIEHYGSLNRTGLPRGPHERALILKFTRQFDLR
jgi:hypothetical protein